VAMTTPVFMQPEEGQTSAQMGFVMPKKIAADQAPQPLGTDVQIRERRGGRFAVIRFAGRLNRNSIAQAEERLRSWMAAEGFDGEETAESAGYDPPWTPGPLRRNEVLVRLR